MGVYIYGITALKEFITEALDKIEGDFSREQLTIACKEIAEEYPHTMD